MVAGGQKRLARDATDIEASPAEFLIFFDNGCFQTELAGADGRDIAARTGADDHNIKFFHTKNTLTKPAIAEKMGDATRIGNCLSFSFDEALVSLCLMTRARHLRRNATRYERILWRHLRNRKFDNWKFRRQHPVDRYILDFYCPEARIAIELDGGGHNDEGQRIEDQGRTDLLSMEDILLLRFWNHQIRENLDGVLQTILLKLDERARGNPSP